MCLANGLLGLRHLKKVFMWQWLIPKKFEGHACSPPKKTDYLRKPGNDGVSPVVFLGVEPSTSTWTLTFWVPYGRCKSEICGNLFWPCCVFLYSMRYTHVHYILALSRFQISRHHGLIFRTSCKNIKHMHVTCVVDLQNIVQWYVSEYIMLCWWWSAQKR